MSSLRSSTVMSSLRSACRVFPLRALAAPRCCIASRRLCTHAGAPTDYPSIDDCKKQWRAFSQVDNATLMVLASHGDAAACTERMIREVVAVDDVEYPKAVEKVRTMASELPAGMMPRKSTAALVGFSGLASLPLVFSEKCAIMFNDVMVTADPPDHGEADTILEIGSWTWGWMEPPLGTISFVILTLQLARDIYSKNVIEEWAYHARVRRIVEKYPTYAPLILMQWSECMREHSDAPGDVAFSSIGDLGRVPPLGKKELS